MDAFERASDRSARPGRSRARLEWLSPPPPLIGMCVRDANGERIGEVVELIVGESGALVAVGIACARKAVVKRVAREAFRSYGDGLVCCFFRAEVDRFS